LGRNSQLSPTVVALGRNDDPSDLICVQLYGRVSR
jgi:hypothetical protein